MNYIDWLNKSLGMPEEAAALCREHCPKVAATEKYTDLKRRFFAGEDTAEDVRAFAEEYGLHPYAMQLVLDELYSAQTRAMYAEHGWDEEIFLDSVRDFAIRTKECIRDFGIVGFTAYNWVSAQLRCEMFRLGRFQFHLQTYSGEDYSAGGYTIRKGETAVNIHIPAGEPISREVRLDAYRRAFRFFGEKYHAFTCSSYLFYEKHYEMLPKTSNILDFMGDFYLYDFGPRKCENVLWRIFHHRDSYDPATLPRDTSLRKAYAEHLEKNGMVVGGASGVFLFDGYEILRPAADAETVPYLKLDKVNFMTDSGKTVPIIAESSGLREPIVWYSDNEAVAVVDGEGNVTALSGGDAVITAVSGEIRASCRVSVDYEGQNPILPPSWGLYICDPEPYVIDSRMYIFGSKDRPMASEPNGTAGYCASEYNVIYSDDMIHWTDAGVTLTLDDIPPEYRGGNRLWGPSCLFRAREEGREREKYYFIANTNSYTSGMVLFEADSPLGPFTNPRPMTMDGNVIGNLDPGVLADEDGNVYFAYQHDGYRFSVCQLNPADFSQLLSETAVEVTDVFKNGSPEAWPDEGQSLKKRGNTYYYLNMLNWQPNNSHRIPVRMAYLMAEHPLGPWRYGGVIIDTYSYLDSSNIQGAFAELNGQWYVSYHLPTPDDSSSRYCWIDPICFNEDGTIRQILPTSSGPKGCFRVGERIQASGGVHFSGGRGDKRIVQRYHGDLRRWWEADFRFTDYPETWYSESGQFIGYRWMEFTADIRTVTVTARTEGEGAVLKIYFGAEKGSIGDGPDGAPIAEIRLPDTMGEYREFTVPAVISAAGIRSFYVVLDTAPEKGRVYVDSLCFRK